MAEDKAFATGCVEIMFNLGNGKWETAVGDKFVTTPPIELWGQVVRPLTFRSLGKNIMLGIRFYAHTACLFLNDSVSLFNNHITDLAAVAGKSVSELHAKLLEAISIKQRLQLIERFLLDRLLRYEKKFDKLAMIEDILTDLKQEDFFDNIENVASRYGITSRYLQKIFLRYTGLTPKLYSRINRFQKSLLLVNKKNNSLTDIAYECGYFDQSHFIRDFKWFTGFIPSAALPENSSALLASPAK